MTQRRPRLGVMGGTFDPVHHGHLVAASEVADRFDLDEVVFVPTGHPTFKQDQDVTVPANTTQPAISGSPTIGSGEHFGFRRGVTRPSAPVSTSGALPSSATIDTP